MLMEVYLSPLMEISVFPEFSGGGVGWFSFTKGNSSKCHNYMVIIIVFAIIVCPRNTVTNSLKYVIARYSHNVNTQLTCALSKY